MNTVKFALDHILGEDNDDGITVDDLNAALDGLDVNAFEIRGPGGPGGGGRGVYPLTAMMNSTCSPNTQNCIGKKQICMEILKSLIVHLREIW